MTTSNRRKDKIETRFEAAGTLANPGPLGRLVRLGWGALLGLAFYSIVIHSGAYVRTTLPHWSVWIYSPFILSVLPYVVNIGFGLNWRAWPRRVALVLLVLGMAANWVLTRSAWNEALGWYLYSLYLYFTAHLGSSFLLSALLATPGCEMRSIPQLLGRMTGRGAKEHYCPGMMDGVDRWERRVKGQYYDA